MNDAINPPVATLLFVDDEPSIMSSLKRLFRPHGYRIHTAESGAEALDTLERERIDLVISDMRMPAMDGAAFLGKVREQWPDVTRILLTGHTDMESTIKAINEGEIYRYINKPWNDDEVVVVVREAIERQRLEQENRRLGAELKDKNDALQAVNASLEEKVANRTEDLRKALKLIQASNKKLKATLIATVQSFAGLAELRAKPLTGHAQRVAEQARNLSCKIGLSEAEQQDVLFAALLHDIGKIGMSDSMLGKACSQLAPDERALMTQHPIRGEQALRHIEQMAEVAKLIRHHHEHFDGSGYPDHLAGLQIPVGSRIIAIVNDYDALQTGSLVQQPMRPTDALGYLVEYKGARYDPHLVDLFVDDMRGQLKGQVTDLPYRPVALRPGMQLSRDLMHEDGYKLLSKGRKLDEKMIEQLRNVEINEGKTLKIYILCES